MRESPARPSSRTRGVVVRTAGETIVARLPAARVGDGVVLETAGRTLTGIVAALDGSRATIAPFGSLTGVAAGDRVVRDDDALACVLGYGALGRAFDACGVPLDGGNALRGLRRRVASAPPPPGERAPVDRAMWTGVPAIDTLLSLGRGARIGLFGAPGCGKSTLLETIARNVRADAVVVALIGERGREAQQWFARLDARTSIVCATSDRAAAERVRAADLAMAQACALRARGLHVVMIVDSLARYANAERERRSGLGETVGRGGYPPAVWAELARYLECAGSSRAGSITMIATVLSDGGDEREPLSDNARSLLDGHIVLSSALARAGRYPAIDVLASASRTMDAVVTREHARAARAVRGALARLAETEDARALGFTRDGDAKLDAALAVRERIEALLYGDPLATNDALAEVFAIAAALRDCD